MSFLGFLSWGNRSLVFRVPQSNAIAAVPTVF